MGWELTGYDENGDPTYEEVADEGAETSDGYYPTGEGTGDYGPAPEETEDYDAGGNGADFGPNIESHDDGTFTYIDPASGEMYMFDSEGNQVSGGGAGPAAGDGAPPTYTRNPDGSYTETREDGVMVTKMPDGSTVTQNPGGSTHITKPDGTTENIGNNPNNLGTIPTGTDKGLGNTKTPSILDAFKTPSGGTDWAKALEALTKGVGIFKGIQGVHDLLTNKNGDPLERYQMKIPEQSYSRSLIPRDPKRVPGSGGLFMTGGSYGAEPAANTPAYTLEDTRPAQATEADMVLPKMAAGGYMDSAQQVPMQMQQGPVQMFAAGGSTAAAPYYLGGKTDGMADEVDAVINGDQPAKLADGEFVIPADVVSHLGNGNSEAGADKLYTMMSKVRKARTGNAEQGKQIDPDKFMPGMKSKKMASGGITDVIPRFVEGGSTGTPAAGVTPYATESGIAPWAQSYVGNVLGQTQGLAADMTKNPSNYVYSGPRTAGASALQQKAFDMAGNLGVDAGVTNASRGLETLASSMMNRPEYQAAGVSSGYAGVGPYDVTKFSTQDFSKEAAEKYMNPYLQLSLDPQIAEARRQADITRMTNAGRLVGSGAFGGGRQAVMEAEGDRNLGMNLADITGKGYNTAFTGAQTQFNADRARQLEAEKASEQSKQFGSNQAMQNAMNAATTGLQAAQINESSRQFGESNWLNKAKGATDIFGKVADIGNTADATRRANLGIISGLGNTQRGIEQAGYDADLAQFNEEAALPGAAISLQQRALQGLPINAQTVNAPPAGIMQALAGLGLSTEQLAKLLGTSA